MKIVVAMWEVMEYSMPIVKDVSPFILTRSKDRKGERKGKTYEIR
jgi:hypothetical protein